MCVYKETAVREVFGKQAMAAEIRRTGCSSTPRLEPPPACISMYEERHHGDGWSSSSPSLSSLPTSSSLPPARGPSSWSARETAEGERPFK